MSAAAMTPRVRTLVCDEAGVFTLEGVRHRIDAPSFPYRHTLGVYLLLSYPRPGTFQGEVRLIDEGADKALRFKKFVVEFDEPVQPVALAVDLGECVFRTPKVYTIAVRFVLPSGDDVLKGETDLPVLQQQE